MRCAARSGVAAFEAEWREGLRFWEVPVIERTWSPLRGWIDGGMAGAIPRPDLRTHTLTVQTCVGAVHDAPGTGGSGQVVAVLVAGGSVGWQAADPPDGERIAELRPALDGLIPH